MRHIGLFGYLVDAWSAFVLLLKLVQYALYLVHATHLVERQTHYATLLCDGLQNALSDPPYGVRDELEAACLVELLGSFQQSDVALVDEVGQRETLVLILLCNGDNKTQIRLCQLLKSLAVAVLYAVGELHFLFCGNQLFVANLLKILIERGVLSICNRFGYFKLSH